MGSGVGADFSDKKTTNQYLYKQRNAAHTDACISRKTKPRAVMLGKLETAAVLEIFLTSAQYYCFFSPLQLSV